MSTYDVYSFGMVSSSTLYRITGAFPVAEGYAEIDTKSYMTGGEAANSSIVLSRLGARVRLDGNWLGADDAGRRTKALLDDYGIDTARLRLKDGYRGVTEVVFAAVDTRTIFGTYGNLLADSAWNFPHEQDVTQAGVVCLDPFFDAASVRVAEIASLAGVPVVTVDCRYDDPLVKNVSALVIAESFIRDNFPDRQLDELFLEYQSNCDGLVVFTFGGKEIWYAGPGETVRRRRPFAIEPVDTTGGGDSFRAGIVYGFLQGWEHDRMIEFAAAVAALVCATSPGVLNSPTLDEVNDFMRTAAGSHR